MKIKSHFLSDNRINSITAWVVCICASLFFSYELMQFHLMNAISSVLMQDLKISASQFGILGSTYLLADVVFLIPAGIILDRYPTRRVILSALLICILGTAGFALSTTFTQACIAHFLSGIGNAFCFLSCIILVSRWFSSDKQAFVVGIVVTIGMLGGVVAQSPFNYLASLCSWREAMLIDALIGIVIFLLTLCFVKDSPQSSKITKQKFNVTLFVSQLFDCIKSRQNILCGLYTALTNLPLMIIGAAWGSLFLCQKHHFSLNESSLIASLICTGTILGSTFFGYISDKIGQRRQLMSFGALASLILVIAMIFVEKASFLNMGLIFLCLGFFSSTQVLSYPLITKAAPSHLVGTSMSISAVIIMGLAGVFQIISGKLLDFGWDGTLLEGVPFFSSWDFTRSFMIFPLAMAVAALSVFFIKEPKEQKVS